MTMQSKRPCRLQMRAPLKTDFRLLNRSSARDKSKAELIVRLTRKQLVETLNEYLDEASVADVERALDFGAQAHEGQHRKSGEPYIQHPIAVGGILAEMRLDSRSIMAAILHDVIEDTPTARVHLEELFGDDVAYLVDGVSKITQIDFENREAAEAETFRKMLLAMSRDIRVILIKLADRLHNMRTLYALSPASRQRISLQTRDIYAPIAQRLGMYEWTQELEDLSFKHIYPKRFNAIAKELAKRKGNRKSVIKKVSAALKEELAKHEIDATVTGREKHVYGVYCKMRDRHQKIKDVKDLYAVRIIVPTTLDCYKTLGIVHSLYKPSPQLFNDYIAIPKANGYQSLHTTAFGTFGTFIEVQIRTESMHRIAEAGVAAHWLYKTHDYEGVEPRQLARKWLVELLENQQEAGSPTEFLEQLKIDLYPDQVYVFTPKGEIKKFPKGATALDFAFAVHSDIGNRAIGAKINQDQVPLHHKLKNGDHMEVLTSRQRQTSPSWLNFVVTSKARASIRGMLKQQREKDAIKLGKRLLERALVLAGKSRRVKTVEKVDLLHAFKRDDWNELLADIGFGRRLPMVVVKQLDPETSLSTATAAENPLDIEGAEGMMISYGKCCSPIPGEHIHGYFSTGKGIVIHTDECSNYAKLKTDTERWIHVNWSDKHQSRFAVNLRLEAKNNKGVLAGATSVIAEHGSNIVNANVIERDAKHSSMDFTIEVTDSDHLEEIMQALKQDESLFAVGRLRG